MSTVALSFLSSPANAISQEDIYAYWQANSDTRQPLDKDALNKLKELNDDQWNEFKHISGDLANGMGKYDRALVITTLAIIGPEKWHEFKTITEALTQNMDGKKRAYVIEALDWLGPKVLFHPELPKGITVFLNMINSGVNKAQAIRELGKHQDLFDSKDFSYYALFQRLANQSSSIKNYHVVKAFRQIPQDKINNPQFLTIAGPLTQNMDGKNCAWVIRSLTELPDDKLSDIDFIPKIKVQTANMDEVNRAWMIPVLAAVPTDKLADPNFIRKINAPRANMDRANRASVSLGLLQVPVEHREKFMSIVGRLTKNMDGKDRSRVISTLVRVKEIHKNRVYGQLQRFVEETTGKMNLKSSSALEWLIRLYPYCTSEDRAIAFTTDLIARVKGAPGTVNNVGLTIYMQSAWSPKSSISLYEFTKLTRKRKNSATDSSVEEVLPPKKRSIAPGSYDD